jgi:hypothetical protein
MEFSMRRLALAALPLLLTACNPDMPPVSQDVTLDPPAAGKGFQLATQTFDVPSGTEDQRCYFFTVPGTGTAPLWVNHLVATQNTGSHHFNVFRVASQQALTGNDGDVVIGGQCWISSNWADWPLVFNDQESVNGNNTVDWTLPDGVAHKFTPGEKLMLQIHYVNATTQVTPGHGKGIINFNFYPGTNTPMELGTVFATNQNIRICPGDTNKSFSTTCRFAKTPVTIAAANGHFHSRGMRFDIDAVDAMNNPIGNNFYTSTQWDEPPFDHSLAVAVPAMGGVGWTCTYNYEKPSAACADAKNNCQPVANGCADASSDCCISFGGHVEVQEHCNAFVYYYPKVDNATCF